MARIRNSRSPVPRKAPGRRAVAPRKTPLQARSKATVDAILDATARVLRRDGYDKASTNRIAEQAGVSVGSLYQYFPGKDALVAALIDRHRAETMARVLSPLPSLSTAPMREAIEALVTITVDSHMVDPKLHRIVMEQVPRVGRMKTIVEDLDTIRARILESFLRERRDELRHDDVETAAFVVIHAAETVVHRAIVDGRMDRERTIREVTDLCARYLLPDP